MADCRRCGARIPATATIGGKTRVLSSRRYCLSCSPFGAHNTRRLDASPAETMRRCAVCEKPYPAGRGQYADTCRSCRVVRRRQDLKKLAVAHLGGRCALCGYDRCLAALQFHHLEPGQKDFQVAEYSRSWERVRAEAEKCLLVCANCHAEVHAGLVVVGEAR